MKLLSLLPYDIRVSSILLGGYAISLFNSAVALLYVALTHMLIPTTEVIDGVACSFTISLPMGGVSVVESLLCIFLGRDKHPRGYWPRC